MEQPCITYIKDLTAPEVSAYTITSENQLYHLFEPAPGAFIAESAKAAMRALDAGYEPISILVEDGQMKGETAEVMARCPEVPVYAADAETLRALRGYPMTRGLLMLLRRKELAAPETVCEGASRIAVLERVVNPTNIGAIFRSAAALGMDGILLSPDCCDPLYRRAIRVSMGCVFQIPWTILQDPWPAQGMARLRDMGFETAAMALLPGSLDVRDERLKRARKLAVILGTEGDGLLPETIAQSDYCVRIPMQHGVDSLNVAAAGAVMFWELTAGR